MDSMDTTETDIQSDALWSAEAKTARRWITDMFMRVHTERDIPANAIFGPCELKHTSVYDSIAFIALKSMDRRTAPYIIKQVDTSVDHLSVDGPVWLRLVQSARGPTEQNLSAYVKNGQLFYRALRDIRRDEELLVWYSEDLAKLLLLAQSKGVPPYICPHCNQHFESEFPFLAHQRFLCIRRLSSNIPPGLKDYTLPGPKDYTSHAEKPESRSAFKRSSSGDSAPGTDLHKLARDERRTEGTDLHKLTRDERRTEGMDLHNLTRDERRTEGTDLHNLVRDERRTEGTDLHNLVRDERRTEGTDLHNLARDERRTEGTDLHNLARDERRTEGTDLHNLTRDERRREGTDPHNLARDERRTEGTDLHNLARDERRSRSLKRRHVKVEEEEVEEEESSCNLQPSVVKLSLQSRGGGGGGEGEGGGCRASCIMRKPGLSLPPTQSRSSFSLSLAAFSPSFPHLLHPAPALPRTPLRVRPAPPITSLSAGPRTLALGPPWSVHPLYSPALFLQTQTQALLPQIQALPPPHARHLTPPLRMHAQNWCARCSLTFRLTSDLVAHMRTRHQGASPADPRSPGEERRHSCPICREVFKQHHHLARHLAAHTRSPSY